MKSLKLLETIIISKKEKTARKIIYGENINIIKGENSSGKSSVIKSIYYGLGTILNLIVAGLILI